MISVRILTLTLCAMVGTAHADLLSGSLTADNAFYAYITTDNTTLGTLVAQGNNWPTTFTFNNFSLRPGQTYYLQIEAINYGGPGAFIGQFNLSSTGFQFSNGSQSLVTNTADWVSIYNDTNSDPTLQQIWVTPTESVVSLGVNGVGPWGTMSGIDASAQWIDGSNNGLSTCQFCTVDFSTVISPTRTSAVPEPTSIALLSAMLAAVGWKLRKRRAGA
jgi:hypothetical protein